FPPQNGVHFYHDLWLALLAEATDGLHLIDAPLVDYRQHGGNVMGAQDRRAPPRLRLSLPGRTWLRREAAGYALARYLAHSAHNRLADCVASGLLRHGEAKIGALMPYLGRTKGAGRLLADAGALALRGHLRLARIAFGHAVVAVGRHVWALRRAMDDGVTQAVDRFDDRLYSLSPGASPVRPRPPAAGILRAEGIVDQRKQPAFRPVFTAEEPAVSVLLPTLNPTEMFAGITTGIDLGLGLAAAGRRVRFIATDLPVFSAPASERLVLGRLPAEAVAQGALQRISLHCGRTAGTIPAHREDTFLATAWWTAHVAQTLMRREGYERQRFLYLIQDYEPNFYAWGPEFADAQASYSLDFAPVFNTTILRDYFGLQGHRFARPDAPAFQPAIDIARFAAGRRRPRPGPRRIAVYGRPEVPRNMFPTTIEALGRFLTDRAIAPDEVELLSVGLRHDPVTLPGGHVLHSLGKLPLADYPEWLLTVDIGLSLMHSPHPSHPPLEMAAAGARVVTNRFANKDLGQLSRAILSVEGTADAVARGLAQAWDMGPVSDVDRWIEIGRLGVPLPALAVDLAARMDAMLAR
ncbi:MAG TPA: glycosyl transferase family 1, partial [Paracoccaceae bacterium]|nr:glycosyl transferase family 1 [Paracoccaceae bacterium]